MQRNEEFLRIPEEGGTTGKDERGSAFEPEPVSKCLCNLFGMTDDAGI
jgi:hypothetical protein